MKLIKDKKSMQDSEKLLDQKFERFIMDREFHELNGIIEDVIGKRQTGNENHTDRRYPKLIYFNKPLQLSAAIILLIIISMVVVQLLNRSALPDRIYDEYFITYTIPDSYRSIELDQEAINYKGSIDLYNAKDYGNAMKAFRSILEKDPQNAFALFFSGMCCMELNDIGNAIKYFGEVIKNKSHQYQEQSLWYLGLCNLKNGELSEAKGIFRKIAANDGYYSPKANEILYRLDYHFRFPPTYYNRQK